jgi:hypothetical protein
LSIAPEERKLEKQLGKLNHRLNGVRAAAKALGGSAERKVVGVKKRVLSAAGRAAICEGGEEAVGEGEEAGEEGRVIGRKTCA